MRLQVGDTMAWLGAEGTGNPRGRGTRAQYQQGPGGGGWQGGIPRREGVPKKEEGRAGGGEERAEPWVAGMSPARVAGTLASAQH